MLARKTILTSAFMSMLFFSATVYAKYYQVTDNATGQVYYTKDVDHKDCGIKFKDSRTGDKVVLPSATVTKISKDQWKQELRSCPPGPEYKKPQCPEYR